MAVMITASAAPPMPKWPPLTGGTAQPLLLPTWIGSLATVGLFIAAVCAAVYAVRTYAEQRRANELEELASLVLVWTRSTAAHAEEVADLLRITWWANQVAVVGFQRELERESPPLAVGGVGDPQRRPRTRDGR